jgi:hypothetical protein
MALLKVEAAKLSNNDLIQGVVEEIIDRDDMFAFLPFIGTNGKAYVYNRENTISEADFADPNDVVNEGASDFTEITTNLRILIGDVDVDKFLAETMSDTSDQRAIQIAQKAKGMGRKFKNALINGDNGVNAKEFDGINQLLIDTGNEVVAGVNGGAITLSMIDELLDSVPNGADALIMRRGTLRALKALWRAAGGNTGGMLQMDNFGFSIPAHDGIPILINDFIPGDVDQGTSIANTCTIYAARLNEVDGLHGLWGGSDMGVRVEDIGTVQNKDATRTRLKWYAGLALKSTQSLAGIRGVTNI